ncbi:hypothetical protein FIBSPDRAFT_874254, partial [Athelia psychrophila]
DGHVRRGCLRASAPSIKDGWKPRQRQGDEGHRRTALTPPPDRAPTRNPSPIFIHLVRPGVPLRSLLFSRRMRFRLLDAGGFADSFTVARVLNVEGLLSGLRRTGDVFEVMSVVYGFLPIPYYKAEADPVAR